MIAGASGLRLMGADRATPPSPSTASEVGESVEFERYVRKLCSMPDNIAVNWDADWVKAAWEGWQARAALAANIAKTATQPLCDSVREVDDLPSLIEAGALRQYMHNDGSGFVAAYDKAITDRVFAQISSTLAATQLEDIERYRMQMAVISTAALGYWKEGDSIHPDYDTVPLRDVTKLYAKYDALYRDAERYRFLEQQCRDGTYRGIISREAIDAAIAATKKADLPQEPS